MKGPFTNHEGITKDNFEAFKPKPQSKRLRDEKVNKEGKVSVKKREKKRAKTFLK